MLFTRKLFPLISLILLGIGAGWIYLSRIPVDSAAADPLSAAQKGFYAPNFTVQTLEGDVVSLSSFRGSPIVLNLWASWCPPCREEMPALENVYTEYKDRGLVVLGANLTQQDSQEAAREFARQYGLSFPILLDLEGEITNNYRVQALPSTYFIDKEGLIRDVILGGPIDEAVLRDQAESLLSGGF